MLSSTTKRATDGTDGLDDEEKIATDYTDCTDDEEKIATDYTDCTDDEDIYLPTANGSLTKRF